MGVSLHLPGAPDNIQSELQQDKWGNQDSCWEARPGSTGGAEVPVPAQHFRAIREPQPELGDASSSSLAGTRKP